MGPHRLELVELLLGHGASTSFKNFSGASILTSLCSSEDCDPELVELMLKYESQSVNYQRRGQSLKWRNIYRLARVLVRTKVKRAGIMVSLARAYGSTALHYAVRRGDVDVVNLLLRHGADPEIIDGHQQDTRGLLRCLSGATRCFEASHSTTKNGKDRLCCTDETPLQPT